ncbi:putative transposase, Ptta/En/Spm, plant [Helianthus annuus]|nr:putative transposase, Ptta/En/Spm, plant [Helianthus annuus]KAJ0518725.1 putative transposase, Ptta/En/Spm, plant [Helianthus annuus]
MYKDGDADQWAGIELGIIAECQSRYSSRKNKLHDHFQTVGGTKDVDRAKSCPPENYDSQKWVDLIDILFTDPAYIRRSNANKENRKKQRYPSYHGSQSYAQRRYIEQKTRSPNYIVVFEKTHYKEGRGWANDICAADWGKIQDKLARASRDVDDTSPVDELEVLKSALGHRNGHARGVGRVVKNVTHEISSSYRPPRQQQQLEEMQEEMQQMRQKIQEMRQQQQQQQQVQVQPFSNQALLELLQQQQQVQVQPFSNQALLELLQQQQQQHAFQMQQMEAQFQSRLNELKRKMRQVDEDDEDDDST